MTDSLLGFFKNAANPGFLINIAGVVLQYFIIVIMYWFLYKIARNIFSGLRKPVIGQRQGKQRLCLISQDGAGDFGVTDGVVYELGKAVSIGRAENNDILVNSPVVSAEHAVIVMQNGSYYIDDLGSTNGTFLNDEPVKGRQKIRRGDIVRIGPASFVVQEE